MTGIPKLQCANVRMGIANRVTVAAGASTTVVTASETAASSLLHFVDGAVTVVVAAGVAVTEGCDCQLILI